ncbi:AraC family transcriptional regulator [Bradyrhizobium forestalis]|uniref:AraC family transcriptional regulator n=1 Tax=Bradyrhizobium forestalis TaxID=1419263 RepID=UPI001304619C|nr:AraC family transcriptional regulator [Bradyrhizobium forestalis]
MTIKRATRFLFDTDVLPPEDRLAVWIEDLGAHGMRLEIARVDLSADEPRAEGNDGFAFCWVGQSGYRILGADGAMPRDAAHGMLLFYGPEKPSVTESGASLTNVRLDGALVRSRIPEIDALLPRQSSVDSAALRLLQAYVDALAASGIPSERKLACTVHHHIVDLIAASLQPNGSDLAHAAGGAVALTRLDAAKTDIRAHLADPALSARQVAQRLGLSERSIYLLFERSGLGFSSFVTEERLARATAMLLDPARQQQRIGDIALAAGFGDLSTFNRSFRRRYGQTPSSMRRSKVDHPDPHRTD